MNILVSKTEQGLRCRTNRMCDNAVVLTSPDELWQWVTAELNRPPPRVESTEEYLARGGTIKRALPAGETLTLEGLGLTQNTKETQEDERTAQKHRPL